MKELRHYTTDTDTDTDTDTEDLIESLWVAKENLEIVPAEALGVLFRYEPDTGRLFWKERPRKLCSSKRHQKRWNDRFAGKEALTSTSRDGYRQGSIFEKVYQAHRVIWALVHGSWPPDTVRHKNLKRDDNRLENLQSASRKGRVQTQKMPSNNTSVCAVPVPLI